MVYEASNTTVSIMRGNSYNAAGDVQDAATAVTTGIPAILVETTKTIFDQTTQQPRTVRTAVLKLPWWVTATEDDQIRDETTLNVYAVIDITRPPTITAMPAGGAPDWELTLRRITAISQ